MKKVILFFTIFALTACAGNANRATKSNLTEIKKLKREMSYLWARSHTNALMQNYNDKRLDKTIANVKSLNGYVDYVGILITYLGNKIIEYGKTVDDLQKKHKTLLRVKLRRARRRQK